MLQKPQATALPYRGQKKSWMDSDLFEEWVRELDRKFEQQNRKVVLIIDNCPAHPAIGGLKAIQLCFLPPNTTAFTQPMDQEVIRSSKAKYRSRLIKPIIKVIDSNKDIPKINVLDAMKLPKIQSKIVLQKPESRMMINYEHRMI